MEKKNTNDRPSWMPPPRDKQKSGRSSTEWTPILKQARASALNGESVFASSKHASRVDCEEPGCTARRGQHCFPNAEVRHHASRKMAYVAACHRKRPREVMRAALDFLGPIHIESHVEDGATAFTLDRKDRSSVVTKIGTAWFDATDITLEHLHAMSALGWLVLNSDSDDRPVWQIARFFKAESTMRTSSDILTQNDAVVSASPTSVDRELSDVAGVQSMADAFAARLGLNLHKP